MLVKIAHALEVCNGQLQQAHQQKAQIEAVIKELEPKLEKLAEAYKKALKDVEDEILN